MQSLDQSETAGARIPTLAVSRVPAAADSDGATAQTVRMMCEYIRKCVTDPKVQAAADYAWRRFAGASPDPAAKCWGVFWYVKHCIKFRLDEATLFRVGESNQQDFLTAPDVLLRMKDPAEDCDGFTMLAACLLTVLGVPVVIATVAADPRRPSEWSHVFPCALLPGDNVMPLDTSHGPRPGWMVPPDRVYRWQAWNLDGDPVEVRPMQHRGLHGYQRAGGAASWGRGMGDTVALQFPEYDGSVPIDTSGGSGTVPIVAPSSPSSWDTFWQNLTASGVNILGKVVTPPAFQSQVTRDQYGNIITSSTTQQYATPGQPGTLLNPSALGISSNVLLIGGGLLAALLIINSMGRGR